MRATYIEVPEGVIRQRRLLGIDQFDEMWDGELHMSPLPSYRHQDEVKSLLRFFMTHWEALGEGVCQIQVGVKPAGTPNINLEGESVPRDYRGPDLVFLLKGHEDRIQEPWIVGAPDAVLEVRSPGDETYKKLSFYHALGVPEVIIVHRDSKAIEVYARGAAEYARIAPFPDGWVTSTTLGTSFRTEGDPAAGNLILRLRRTHHPDREGIV